MKRFGAVILVLFAFSALNLCGQALTSLNGTVNDPSGAVVAGASVTLTNLRTGAQRQDKSDTAGRYGFQQVQPGRYKLGASAAGFTETVVNDVELLVNTPTVVNIAFEKIGTVAEVISVTAEAVQVNTTDASLGNAISNRPITQLPFEARNVVGLLSLQPGVTYLGPNIADDFRSGSVNGAKSDQSNVVLDGVDVNDEQDRIAFTSVLRVTLDSVEEFRTTTSNANADQGRGPGAQVTLITKGGTNDLHGSLYEYHRNTITSANSFFNNEAGVPRQKLIRNVFGASVGGPFKKNRVFYFMNYEGRRDATESPALRIVPTENFRNGFFNYVKTDGSIGQLTPQQIKDVDPLHIGPSEAVLQLLQSYPLPNTDVVGDGLNTSGFRFKAPTPLRYNTYIAKFDAQLDNDGKHRVFWRGNLQNDNNAAGLPQFPGDPASSVTLANNKGYAAGYTWLATPSLISNFRYGYTRQGGETTGILSAPYVTLRDIDSRYATTTGLSQILPVHTFAEDLTWNKGGHTVSFGGLILKISNHRVNYLNSFSDGYANSSWLLGTGKQLLVPDANPSTDYTRKMVDLLGIISEGDAQYNYDTQGNVLPQGTGIKRDFVGPQYEIYGQDSWKVTRALTVTAGLRASFVPPVHESNGLQTSANINLGDWLDMRGQLAAEGKSQALAPKIAYQLANAPGGRPLYQYQKDFSPRIGLAYSPQTTKGFWGWLFGGPGKTSVRAGFGMYYDLFGQGIAQLYDSTALGFSTGLQNPATGTLTAAPRYTGFYDLPSGLLPPAPKGGFPQVQPDIFQITTGLDDKLQSPYSMNMNFSIGREFSHGFFVQGAYVGRLSRHSLNADDVAMPTNLKDPKSGQTYFQAASQLWAMNVAGVDVSKVPAIPFWEDMWPGAAGGGLTATQSIYTNVYQQVSDATTALTYLDVPDDTGACYPSCSKLGPYTLFNSQYSSLAAFRSIGSGDYHSMQWTVRKRFSSGVQFDFNYTFSKSIDLASTREKDGRVVEQIINAWDPRQMRAVSDYDTTHIFSAFWVVELPFGRAKKFGGGMGKALDAIVGGWQVSGIFRQTSGLPATTDNGGFWPTNWNVEGYASQIAPVKTGTNKNAMFVGGGSGPNIFPDPTAALAAFANTLPGQSGNRNPIRGDGYFGIDLGLGKRFIMPWKESHSIQFRVEAFNVSNTVRFDTNNVSVTNVSLSLGSPNTWGNYAEVLTTPRVIQFSARYEF